jgi:transposase
MAGVLYKLRTGCPWKALGREFGSGATCHRRFAEWSEQGLFRTLWRILLLEYDSAVGVGLDWTSLDSAIVKAPKGGTIRVPTRPIVRKAARNGMF